RRKAHVQIRAVNYLSISALMVISASFEKSESRPWKDSRWLIRPNCAFPIKVIKEPATYLFKCPRLFQAPEHGPRPNPAKLHFDFRRERPRSVWLYLKWAQPSSKKRQSIYSH
ncbi:MAG TPA: hypothetical protein VHD56_16575, partial [Tepidisphaeraceae bacterium]|nr:hypothetical protein [Tepidisphaeraceae bacterium]